MESTSEQKTPTKPHIWVNQIQCSDQTKLELERNDIVVIVGPNNSGKSTFLREIANIVMIPGFLKSTRIIKDLSLQKVGDTADLLALLNELCKKTITDGDPIYTGYKVGVRESSAKQSWTEFKSLGLRELQPFFVNVITSDGRLGVSNKVPSIDFTNENPQHPIHFLYDSDSTAEKFSEAFKRAFNTDLIVNKGAGKVIPLHVGDRPPLQEQENVVSTTYLRRLQELPTIEEQGDGMRSFVGLLMQLLLGNQSMALVDEPEVFLHPPQARLLGRMVATEIPNELQIFFATHSEDFLKGLLDTNSDRIKIIRLTRDKTSNTLQQLAKTELKGTWNDPFLRHSNVLGGLFHSNVILCEADMDCKFYSAILDAIVEEDRNKKKEERHFKTLPDPLFIHCGGKYRMPLVIKSLTNLSVSVSVICDFDVLSGAENLRNIFEALGGEWSIIENEWNIVNKAIESKKAELDSNGVKDRIGKVLEKEKGKHFTDTAVEEIRAILKKTSPWAIAKDVGKSFIPSGDATNAYNKITGYLNAKGLFVVEVGEVEKFDKTIGNHGPKWVNEVLSKDIKNAPELAEAKNFVGKILMAEGI